MSDDIQLPPCPFCGATAIGREHRNVDEIIIEHKDDCVFSHLDHQSGLVVYHWNGEVPGKGVLFKVWNTRICPPNPQDQRADAQEKP